MVNLKRGLFRLWLVGSIFSLAGAGSLAFGSWSDIRTTAALISTDNDPTLKAKRIVELQAMPAAERDRIGETLYELELENRDKTSHTMIVSAKMLRETKELEDRLSRSKEQLNENWLLMIIPPLALFIVGCPLLWALSGFIGGTKS